MSYTIDKPITDNHSKVEKLPVWAKDHIRQLERHALRCQEELKRLLDNETPTDISITSHTIDIGDRKYIPADSVSFKVGNSEIEVRIVEATHLHVMMTQSINGKLSIRPCVTNVIDIYPE